METLREAPLPFLASLLAIQLLSLPKPPGGRILLLMCGVLLGVSALAWTVATAGLQVPGLYTIGIGALYLWGFALTFRPKTAMIGTLFVTLTVVVTTVSAASGQAAIWIVVELLGSLVAGFFLVVVAHWIFPDSASAQVPIAEAAGPSPIPTPVQRAVLATAVMLPVQLYLTSDGIAAMIVLMTTATMLRQPGLGQAASYGLSFASGNAVGGVLAAMAAFALAMHTELVLVAALGAAGSMILVTLLGVCRQTAGALQPSLIAFCILFGMVLSPLPLADDVDYMKRVLQILTAALYAIAAVSLLVPLIRGFGPAASEAR
jgi:hypothetical protein